MEIQLFVCLLLSSYDITINNPAALPRPVRDRTFFLVSFLLTCCCDMLFV